MLDSKIVLASRFLTKGGVEMNRGNRIVGLLVAGLSMVGALSALPVVAHADATIGDIFYTTYDGVARVFTRSYSFDGTTLTYGGVTTISSTTNGLGGADGIVFDPTDPNYLLIGGQNNFIYRVNIATGTATASSATTGANYHLAITPDGVNVLGSDIPGTNVSKVSLSPFGDASNFTIVGADSVITGIVFDGLGNAYYSTANAVGTGGNFGTAVFGAGTITTTRLLTGLDAHGLQFDPFTGDILLFGDNQINQFDLGSNSIIGTLAIGGASAQFDQGTIDGKGHVFVASNDGNMLFIDYSASGNVGSGTNFTNYQFFQANLDDVAPLSGLGSHQPVPEPASMLLFGLGGIGAAFSRRRKFFAKI